MPEAAAARPSVVRSFVRRFRTEILAEWKRSARQLSEARTMNAVTLVDHIPELLDEIADIAEEIAAERQPGGTFETARRHALDRLAEGFDITTVVRELSLLRGAALAVWDRANVSGNVAELRALDLAIDRAIAVSVGRYTEAHERTLAGIDRISTASFESSDLQGLLQRLLEVFIETTPAVDTAAILMLEDGELALRAQVGVPVALDGLPSMVVARRAPVAMRVGARALYGVPLIHNGAAIGAAVMGSVTAHDLSLEDRQFFSSMAARATNGIALTSATAERVRTIAKLESLLAAAPAGIAFVDRDLRYQRINDALAAVNGRPAAEHIGRTVAEMLPGAADVLVPMLRRVIETGEPVINNEIEHAGRSLIASYFPVRTPAGEVFGVGGIVTDVTDLKHAQDALRTEQARIEAIIEHAPAAIWIKDRDGNLVLANRRLADALGHRFEDVIGHSSMQLLPPDIAAEHEDHDRIVLAEQRAIEFEETVPSPDGTRTFLSTKFPIPGESPLVGGIATEITQRKEMERELRLAVRTREDVLAVVSHDLRNPLGTVQLSAGLLMDRLGGDHRARRHLEMIQRSCKRMETLIDDLLDTANIRAGRLALEVERESAGSVVNEAVDLQEPTIEEHGIKLVRACAVDGVELLCDRDRILQVFGNLIGNAIKFCRPGDTITVGCEVRGDEVSFVVADTGPGIQPDVLPYLFDPYWSAPRKTNKGAGLGLYIARGIVEGHGGRIGVESAPGAGATFRFTLPRAR
jgi:PAS domain S-box-containing protein